MSDTDLSDQKPIAIPRNFFAADVFQNGMPERHEYEQFFWTRDTVLRLMKACEFIPDACCLTTPSLAYAWHQNGREELLLDIDERFADMVPRYRYYDVRVPTAVNETFQIIIMDPPFFVVPIADFRRAVDVITGSDFKTKFMVGFLKRKEKELLQIFAPYRLRRTAFNLEYASIKPNKWRNFCLYSNIDLPGIKRK